MSDNACVGVIGWSDNLGQAIPAGRSHAPKVSADEAYKRIDRSGDGRVSADEKQWALDHFEPSKATDHAAAKAKVLSTTTKLKEEKENAAHWHAVNSTWGTTAIIGAITGGVAGVGMAIFAASVAAIPVVWTIFLVVAILAGLLVALSKIIEYVASKKMDKADAKVSELQKLHDEAWEELGYALPVQAPQPGKPAGVVLDALRPTASTGVNLRNATA